MNFTEGFRTGIVGMGREKADSSPSASLGVGMTNVGKGLGGGMTSAVKGNEKANWDMKKKTKRGKGCKERGEWAELCFMARAKGLGMGVLTPHGESMAYDVAVESGGPISRVQVKSTTYCRRGTEYSLNVMGPGRNGYQPGTVDFFAVWVIPIGEWYIIPYAAMGKRKMLTFTPGSKRSKWIQYREAWDLLRVVEIQACVDPRYLTEVTAELIE